MSGQIVSLTHPGDCIGSNLPHRVQSDGRRRAPGTDHSGRGLEPFMDQVFGCQGSERAGRQYLRMVSLAVLGEESSQRPAACRLEAIDTRGHTPAAASRAGNDRERSRGSGRAGPASAGAGHGRRRRFLIRQDLGDGCGAGTCINHSRNRALAVAWIHVDGPDSIRE